MKAVILTFALLACWLSPAEEARAQGFRVVNQRLNICETDDGQKFPCGEPTPAPRNGTPQTANPTPNPNPTPTPGNGTPPVNRAENWEAKKEDNTLFDEPAGRDTQKGAYTVKLDATGQMKVYETTNGAFQTQADAFVAHNNVLIGCTGTNINGRTDNLCTLTPNHPECTGLNATLQNAVFCAEPPPPGSPPGTPCRSFGAYNYTIDEWLVFGQHYYNGMSTCVQAKDGPDKSTERRNRMVALTDIASFPGTTPGDLKDGSSASSITGETKVVNAETRAKEMMERFDDGAAYLGFNKGELILRAYKGESFITAFSDSPFAEKLAKSLRETVDYALGNPAEPMEKAKEKRVAEIEKKKQEAEAKGEPLEAEGARSLASGDNATGPVAGTGGDNSASGGGSGASASLHAYGQGSPSGAAAGSGSAQINSLRQDGLLGKTVLSGGPGSYGDQPASLSPAAGSAAAGAQAGLSAEPEEASLFQRVKVSYRRYAPQLRAYGESKAARDVRLTDTPEFFRDL